MCLLSFLLFYSTQQHLVPNGQKIPKGDFHKLEIMYDCGPVPGTKHKISLESPIWGLRLYPYPTNASNTASTLYVLPG